MAKTSRSPYNGARYITRQILKNTEVTVKMTGEVLFVDASSSITLNISFMSKGSYFKIIIKDHSTEAVTINMGSVSGILFSDDGTKVISESYKDQQQLTIPAGSAAGSFIDLLCDGEKWYAQGLIAQAPQ
jgi:hypothetical protein